MTAVRCYVFEVPSLRKLHPESSDWNLPQFVSALLSELGVDSTAPDALDLLDALQLAELVEVARSDARVAEVVSGMAPDSTRAREILDLVLDPER